MDTGGIRVAAALAALFLAVLATGSRPARAAGGTYQDPRGASSTTASAQGKKLKVFILAGQSNMEGHAAISTFDYIGKDPAFALSRSETGHPLWGPVYRKALP